MAAVEYRLQLPHGSRRWVEAQGLATFVGDGDSRRAVSFDGSVQNISASRQLQEALRLEPNKLRNVLENIPFGVDIVNARYRSNTSTLPWKKTRSASTFMTRKRASGEKIRRCLPAVRAVGVGFRDDRQGLRSL